MPLKSDRNFDIQTLALGQLGYTDQQALLRLTSVGFDSHMKRLLDARPERVQCFLVRRQGRVVGWSLLQWFREDAETGRDALLSVFVDRLARQQGLGSALVREAVEIARAREMTPWAYAGNLRQARFYSRFSGLKITNKPFPQ